MPQRYYVEKSMNPNELTVEYPVDFDGMVVVPPNMVGTLAAPSKAKPETFEQTFKRLMHPEQKLSAKTKETVYKAQANSALLRQLRGH
jgi:hypothetical protein